MKAESVFVGLWAGFKPLESTGFVHNKRACALCMLRHTLSFILSLFPYPWKCLGLTQGKLNIQMLLCVKNIIYKVTHNRRRGKSLLGGQFSCWVQLGCSPRFLQGSRSWLLSLPPSPPFPALKQIVPNVPNVDKNMPFASLEKKNPLPWADLIQSH